MEQLQIKNLYDLTQTIAAPLFEGAVYPWELLPKISTFIVELGNSLPAWRERMDCQVCYRFPHSLHQWSLHY